MGSTIRRIVPRPLPALPGLTSGACTVLTDGGTVLVVAEDRTVAAYRITPAPAPAGSAVADYGQEPARPLWRHDLPGPAAALVPVRPGTVVVGTTDGHVVVVDRAGRRPLADLGGTIATLAVRDGDVLAAVEGEGTRSPALVELDGRSGRTRSVTALPSARVAVEVDPTTGDVLVADASARTVRRLPRAECPPPGRDPRDVPRPRPRPCRCHPGGHGPAGGPAPAEPQNPGSPGWPELGPLRGPKGCRPEEECRPGGTGVPHGCFDLVAYGQTVTRRWTCGGGPGRECAVQLDWSVASLRRAGSRVLATSADGRHLAFLDVARFSVVGERTLRRGTRVVAAADAAHVLLHDAAGWTQLGIEGSPAAALDLDVDLVAQTLEPAVFIGPLSTAPAAQAAATPTTGTLRVLVVPFIEPGQTFGDADLTQAGAWLHNNAFTPTHDYLDEASYRLLDARFDLFGYDAGPTGGPLLFPALVRNFYHPPFVAGGVRLSRTLGVLPASVGTNGAETLTVTLHTTQGDEQTLVVPMAALSLRAEYDTFPSIVLTGTQTATLQVTQPDGTPRTLDLTFPAETHTLSPGSLDADLAGLAASVDSVLLAAETAAGVPAGERVFAPVEALRIPGAAGAFGRLEVVLRLVAAAEDPAGRVRVMTADPGLDSLGFGDALPASLDVPGNEQNIGAFYGRMIAQAQARAGNSGSAVSMSSDVAVDLVGGGPGAGILHVTLSLSAQTGGDGAFATVDASDVAALGFDGAAPVIGSGVANAANAVRDIGELLDHAFTAMLDRLDDAGEDVSFFDDYHVVTIGFLGGTPSTPPAWQASIPDTEGLRARATGLTTADSTHADDERQLQRRFNVVFLEDPFDLETFVHEHGHSIGFGDLYWETGHRDDVIYIGGYCLMGNTTSLHHFCGFNKQAAGWIPADRVVEVERPDETAPTDTEALLVPVEYWDDGMAAAVRAAFGGSVPIAQLMRIDLGGDGLQYTLVEVRQQGVSFSQDLPTEPAVILTNGVDPSDDTRYAQNDAYRRRVHLMLPGDTLRTANDSVDLGAAPEFPVPGTVASIVATVDVVRPDGPVRVFHVRVDRAAAPHIDLALVREQGYLSSSVWIDWPGNNDAADEIDDYALGSPTDQGDTVRVPASGVEPHRVVVRVHNFGNARAEDVDVRVRVKDPFGAGDDTDFVTIGSATIPELAAGAHATVAVPWDVAPGDREHVCIRAEITDWTVPLDPTASEPVAIASDDVTGSNNWAQQNAFEFVAESASLYAPVTFRYAVANGGPRPERARLEPEILPPGMRLTVRPPRAVVPADGVAVFTCVLEVDEDIVDAPGCRHDGEFVLWAWRDTGESEERWGASKITVRPRRHTETVLEGWWDPGHVLRLHGTVTPAPGAGVVELRYAFEGQPADWVTVALTEQGTYSTARIADVHEPVEILAHFPGSSVHAPSYSEVLHLQPFVPVG